MHPILLSLPMAFAAEGTPALPEVAEAGDRVHQTWSGNLTSSPDRLAQPTTVDELRAVIRDAVATGATPCVMRGAMHSWSPVAVQDEGTAIDLSRLTFPPVVDDPARTAAVPGSMLLVDLYAVLVENGLALSALPMVTTSTVAGSAATDSHGWNLADGHFNHQISQIRLIDARGRDILIDVDGCWEIDGDERRLLIGGPEALASARHHRGVLGAIYQVTFQGEPTFDLELTETASREIDAFGEHAERLAAFLDEADHASVIWFVQRQRVLLRRADRTTLPPKPRKALAKVVVDDWIRTRLASGFLQLSRHSPPLTGLFNALASTSFPRRRVFRDRWDIILTYLPGHATTGVGLRLMEYGIPLDHLERALELVREGVRGFRMPMPMGIRRGGDQVFLEFMWQRDYPGAEEVARGLERRFVDEFGADAVPHDGKLFWENPWPRVPAAERASFLALRAELDPAGVFTNEYMRHYLAGKALRPGTP